MTTDEAALAPFVARLFAAPAAEVIEFTRETISYKASNPVSVSLERYRGTAMVSGEARPWSLVLKTIAEPSLEPFARLGLDPAARARLREVSRWDREALVYGSGLLGDLTDGLSAPTCVGIEWEDRRARLWLESVHEDVPDWDLDRYVLAARHLGTFNARWLTRDLTPQEWMSRDAIASWTEAVGSTLPGFLADDAIWRDPVVRAELPADARDDLGRLWSRRHALYDVLRAVPHGFAHLDAFRGNLLARQREGRSQTVAIDWSFAGLAPVGAEVSQLVCATVFFQREPIDPWVLDRATFDGYVDGLREGGYRLDRNEVRRGAVAATVVRWSFILFPLALARDPEARQRAEARTGLPYREQLARLGEKIRFTLERANELDAL